MLLLEGDVYVYLKVTPTRCIDGDQGDLVEGGET
jgi:hypothetical protein